MIVEPFINCIWPPSLVYWANYVQYMSCDQHREFDVRVRKKVLNFCFLNASGYADLYKIPFRHFILRIFHLAFTRSDFSYTIRHKYTLPFWNRHRKPLESKGFERIYAPMYPQTVCTIHVSLFKGNWYNLFLRPDLFFTVRSSQGEYEWGWVWSTQLYSRPVTMFGSVWFPPWYESLWINPAARSVLSGMVPQHKHANRCNCSWSAVVVKAIRYYAIPLTRSTTEQNLGLSKITVINPVNRSRAYTSRITFSSNLI